MLKDKYDMWSRKLASDPHSLDMQVTKLCAGDLRIARKRDAKGKVKYNPNRDRSSLEVFGGRGENFNSSDEDERDRKKLFKKCFNKKNMALGRMIRTTEKL